MKRPIETADRGQIRKGPLPPPPIAHARGEAHSRRRPSTAATTPPPPARTLGHTVLHHTLQRLRDELACLASAPPARTAPPVARTERHIHRRAGSLLGLDLSSISLPACCPVAPSTTR